MAGYKVRSFGNGARNYYQTIERIFIEEGL